MRGPLVFLILSSMLAVRSKVFEIKTTNPVMIRLGEYIKTLNFKRLSKLRDSKIKLKQAEISKLSKSRKQIPNPPDAHKLPPAHKSPPSRNQPFPHVNPFPAKVAVAKPVSKIPHSESFGSKMASLFKKLPFKKRQIQEKQFKGNDANHLFSYLGEFSVGTPAKSLRLLMDTGSSRMWVRGPGQCNPDSEKCQDFDPKSSQTARDLSEAAPRITYGDGSFVEGHWITDSVGLGSFTSENFKFQVGTFVQDAADEDGIIGLGYSTTMGVPTLWESLIMQTIPDSPVFSTYIDETETEGAFIIGGTDLARYKGDITWSIVANNSGVYWAIEVKGINVGETKMNSGSTPDLKTVIDTGTSLAIFPQNIADEIRNTLNLPRLNLGGPTDNYVGFPCESGSVPPNTNLPSITISVDNQDLVFSPNEYLFVYPDNDDNLQCILGVIGSDMDHIILGNLFLRKYYLVFDQWFKKIGFATPNRAVNVQNNYVPTNSHIWWPGKAAIQIEGAWNESRSPSVWDNFLKSGNPNATIFGSIDVTADHYHRYESDLSILKTLGANLYRFSFSWSRILPDCNGTVNKDAVNHYIKVIDSVIANGAEPVATMHHWDLPASCMKSYNGWASSEIVSDFVNYADVLLSIFSGKIKYWLTMNEPSNICILGYGSGKFAPNLNLGLDGQYKCGHNSVLATAYVIQLAKNKYPGTIVSYPLVSSFGEPLDPNSQQDIDAGIRSMEFTLGWFLEPFFTMDYPKSMRNDARVGPVLPVFSSQDKDALSLGIEFLAVNYYTSYFIHDSNSEPGNYAATPYRNGIPIGPMTGIDWQFTFPQGLDKLLKWIDSRYPLKSIWITELGCAAPNESELPLTEILKDDFRIDFLNQHLEVIMNSTSPIYAVLIWSLIDNWEWQFGYKPRFGVVSVDFNNGTLARNIKSSGYWLKDYFKSYSSITTSSPDNSPLKNHASNSFPMKYLMFFMIIIIL